MKRTKNYKKKKLLLVSISPRQRRLKIQILFMFSTYIIQLTKIPPMKHLCTYIVFKCITTIWWEVFSFLNIQYSFIIFGLTLFLYSANYCVGKNMLFFVSLCVCVLRLCGSDRCSKWNYLSKWIKKMCVWD